MRVVLVVPISPHHPGNGLAHRARFWQETLAPLGELTTLVLPLVGPFAAGFGDVEVDVTSPMRPDASMPFWAQHASEALGQRWRDQLGPIDLVVGLRSYVGLFSLGLCTPERTRIVIDLDDDDVAFFAAAGDDDQAARFKRLVDVLRKRVDLAVAALSFDGVVEVPNSIADAPLRSVGNRPPHLAMVGNFGYEPNVDGARWFIDEVWPLVERVHPNATLAIAGPGSDLLPYGVGYVQQLHEFYNEASIALVPVRRGSGTRIKALEAWAHAVPVVGTTVGLSGLRFTPGRDALVADGPVEFAAAIGSVLTDSELAESLSSQGRAVARSTYDRDLVAASARTLIYSLLEAPPRMSVPASGNKPTHAPDLDVSETSDGLVVFEPTQNTAHDLNASAAIIFALADGTNDEAAIGATLQELFSLPEPPLAEVATTVARLRLARILR